MTNTNTEAVEALRGLAEAIHALNPALCDPKEASEHYDRASKAFSVLRHNLASFSPTAKTEQSEPQAFCNKCGFIGFVSESHNHNRRDGSRCPYVASIRSTEPSAAGLAYERPVGTTFEQMRENVRKTTLCQRGDTVLIWVNEADLCPLTALSAPTRERELLREARDVLHKHYVDWDGEPEDVYDAYTMRKRIDNLLNEGSGHE